MITKCVCVSNASQRAITVLRIWTACFLGERDRHHGRESFREIGDLRGTSGRAHQGPRHTDRARRVHEPRCPRCRPDRTQTDGAGTQHFERGGLSAAPFSSSVTRALEHPYIVLRIDCHAAGLPRGFSRRLHLAVTEPCANRVRVMWRLPCRVGGPSLIAAIGLANAVLKRPPFAT